MIKTFFVYFWGASFHSGIFILENEPIMLHIGFKHIGLDFKLISDVTPLSRSFERQKRGNCSGSMVGLGELYFVEINKQFPLPRRHE